jgi:hypothetical protein
MSLAYYFDVSTDEDEDEASPAAAIFSISSCQGVPGRRCHPSHHVADAHHACDGTCCSLVRSIAAQLQRELLLESVFQQWTVLMQENSRVSPPNMLHMAYISLMMSQCIIAILQKVVHNGLNSTATMAVNMLTSKLNSAMH